MSRAVNTFNFETIKYIVAGAEQEHMPVIVQFFPGFYEYIPLKLVAAIACHYAEQASVPVAVHLDHSAGYDIAVGGIRDGFPSVMVDGSSLPYEENVALNQGGRRGRQGLRRSISRPSLGMWAAVPTPRTSWARTCIPIPRRQRSSSSAPVAARSPSPWATRTART